MKILSSVLIAKQKGYKMIDGKKIAEFRKKKGLSRAALSRESGIPLRTLENWESGTSKVTGVERINKLCDVLHCNIADLYNDEIFKEFQEHNKAVLNSMISQDDTPDELELLQHIQRVYQNQGLTGILKVLDRMIYKVGINEALEVIKEYMHESD
ncbi:helix-turn-helix domain-containing protein [Bariatricus massiliensis]|uniref:Helix-turn-helix domain-containing protein n=1 Tax=Bariatricus massiliensis TaxID=1745713 RepID=A0ABS8DE52_9FIRM|nr:helix-turn-helix transcriptional regulator [Bariatricus massiliensis]MCB7302501.1 helix-turn-helix domain-containing protein [Bariatricus massiliensis]MCB7373717.1 helix-turn-helix domain-containing protein [Bariatricus massiliensis]MCB7386387.1 helix-turn-helix domain-containing protein [Bariatricus massiliensis]MCB7410549.1 helix-turn-helix domain-containing protein [Bariatricus massiliensis]MCQ5253614.1 helix-turn-helix domain-containing protein [Bariatricus massiliensis]